MNIVLIESLPPMYPRIAELLQERGFVVQAVRDNSPHSVQLDNRPSVIIVNSTANENRKQRFVEELRSTVKSVPILDLIRSEQSTSTCDAFLRDPFTLSDLTEFIALLDGDIKIAATAFRNLPQAPDVTPRL